VRKYRKNSFLNELILFSAILRRMNLRRRGAVGPNHQVDNALDHDVCEALHKAQPSIFKGEGKNVGEATESWIDAMDEYFDVAGYNDRSKMALARLKISGVAKTGWKNHCESNHIKIK